MNGRTKNIGCQYGADRPSNRQINQEIGAMNSTVQASLTN